MFLKLLACLDDVGRDEEDTSLYLGKCLGDGDSGVKGILDVGSTEQLVKNHDCVRVAADGLSDLSQTANLGIEVAVATVQGIRKIDCREKAVAHGKAHRLGRDRKSEMREEYGDAERLHERGLPGHVRSGEENHVALTLSSFGNTSAETNPLAEAVPATET